ncbi:8-amino-7-oxononanoate synthase [Chlamydia trachomatis]|uniref:aminotransferase class I/II-fold pyridoxal phosphate-dependent enzyme n=1 Tax=Chlamydia trachomatis TaxID=813 RepID=UPI00038DCF19|nr:aminotransferase class I/II-fold pyridoxal phosphate-dependent enzyme [Chlamydia trachomatis]AGT72309.1 8-amino-7-oxononanoate synthase [Chlamydia trachomatis]
MKEALSIDFITNDFLGFSRSDSLVHAVEARYRLYCRDKPHAQLGYGGSRAILGSSSLLDGVEHQIAHFHGAPEALILPSGFVANTAICAHLSSVADYVIWDEQVHISVSYNLSVFLSGWHQSFRHNDLDHLESLLESCQQRGFQRVFILVCSVYSFKGSFAPLEQIVALSYQYHAQLIVDEAHAVGLFGDAGKGFCASLGYENFYSVLVTFSKALGSAGAAWLSSRDRKQDLIKEPMVSLSTGIPPYLLVSIQVAYEFLSQEGELARTRLRRIRDYFAQKISWAAAGFVQPFSLPGISEQELYQKLVATGIRVGVACPPTGKVLRANLHAFNTEQEVDILVSLLATEQVTYQKNVVTGSTSTMQRTLEDNFAAANAS